ncbi:coiled-coil domain-containing protein 125 [Echinops telfairi]|uniref:Coiled-coil domain-containing protein 125 n=1 Tax=Echinops telfairi TaxID=9371 RepID=A0AC55CLS1_ECHTE|nr:coiled-coil domain-containing protein 125 [Echinops telfairi]
MSKAVRSLSDSEAQAWGAEDDMTDGDLGYGLGRRPGGIYEGDISHLFTSRRRWDGNNVSPPPCPGKGAESGGAISQFSKCKSVPGADSPGHRAPGDGRQCDSNSELSTVELKQRLHEALEEVEVLKTELEASQRQLEGKEEALKILQSMAIFGKATSHTQAVLQKTVQQKRSLEKEINTLQWEIEFDQNRFKNLEESWIQKYDRLNCENAVLKETLKLKTKEIKILKSENAILNQRHLEALAMLEIRQQTTAQEARGHSQSSCFTEVSGLELAVLGACLCHGPGGSPCSCARMGASTRRLLLQLKQEVLTARTRQPKHRRHNNEKNPGEETFSLKNPWHKTSELPGLHDPINSDAHTFHSMTRMSSNPHPQADQNYTRTLKKSHSLPSGIMF